MKLTGHNSRISTKVVAQTANIDNSTVFRRLKAIGYTLKLNVWLSHLFCEADKMSRPSAAFSSLDRLNNEPFLDRLVIGGQESKRNANERDN